MKRYLFACVIGVLVCFATTRAAEDDPIKVKLDAAKKDYDDKCAKFKKAVGEWLDKKEDTARKAGNKPLVDQIKLAREIYEDTGSLPVVPPPDVVKILTGAQKAYDTAMQAAIKDYTKAKQDERAAAVTQQLKDFREEIDPRTPLKKSLLGTWMITLGDYKAEWTFKENGTVTSSAGAVKEGQWAFDLSKNAVLIVWGKDLVDKFDLPLNAKGTNGSQVGRENKKLTAVKVP